MLSNDFLENTFGFSIPTGEIANHCNCNIQVSGIDVGHPKTFQEWLIRAPVKLGGLGACSIKDISSLAFIGGVSMALPSFTGEGGICKVLTEEVELGSHSWMLDLEQPRNSEMLG